MLKEFLLEGDFSEVAAQHQADALKEFGQQVRDNQHILEDHEGHRMCPSEALGYSLAEICMTIKMLEAIKDDYFDYFQHALKADGMPEEAMRATFEVMGYIFVRQHNPEYNYDRYATEGYRLYVTEKENAQQYAKDLTKLINHEKEAIRIQHPNMHETAESKDIWKFMGKKKMRLD